MKYPLARCPDHNHVLAKREGGYINVRFESGWVGIAPMTWETPAAVAAYCPGHRGNHYLRLSELSKAFDGERPPVVAPLELKFSGS